MNGTYVRMVGAGAAAIVLPGLFLAFGALLLPELAYPLAKPGGAWAGATVAAVQGCLISLVGCAATFLVWRVLHQLQKTQLWIFALVGLAGGFAVSGLNSLTVFWDIAWPTAGVLTGSAVWAIAYWPNGQVSVEK